MKTPMVTFALSALLTLPASADDAAIKGVNISLFPPGRSSLVLDPAAPGPDAVNELDRYNSKRLKLVAAAGFNLIRLRFHLKYIEEGASPQSRDLTLKAASDFIAEANGKGVKVLIALFPESGKDQKELICDNQDRLIKAVDSIIKALPDSSLTGIEPLNEPFTGCGTPDSPKRWINFQYILYKHVRAARPHFSFVASGGNWGADLLGLDPSPYRNDPNVSFSLHFYDPALYTGQSASWNFLPPFNKYVLDLPWPYRKDAVEAVQAKVFQAMDADTSLDDGKRASLKADLSKQFAAYAHTGTEQAIAASLDTLSHWASSHAIAANRVFLGEFGVIRPSQDTRGRLMVGADVWIKAVAKLADERRFQWAIWDLDTSYAIGFGHHGDADKITEEVAGALQ